MAVLIDADNASPTRIGAVLKAVDCYGIAHIKRAYGDWSRPHLSGWRAPMLAYSIRPMHHPNWTTGKNSTDLAMTVDAMDLLHTGNVASFVLVTSDADFTGLAMRIRESGLPRLRIRRGQNPETVHHRMPPVHRHHRTHNRHPQNPRPANRQPTPTNGAAPDPLQLDPNVIAARYAPRSTTRPTATDGLTSAPWEMSSKPITASQRKATGPANSGISSKQALCSRFGNVAPATANRKSPTSATSPMPRLQPLPERRAPKRGSNQ
ncbi:NYN domain-containing protein [Nocardia xishanensis]|uniref:NYN domain-containing protein n=1 Tax=Nocardia xishanensis TaxID=238964 RepID=UPI000A47ED28|nr:NYN domain-containing protein [Nocardia xishanensis]